MAFSTNEDLQQYAPEVFDQGVEDWTAELAKAEADVTNYVKVRWHSNHYSRTQWDAARLTETQWTKATVYRALAVYILPKLSTFRPEGDPFREQITFYKELYAEEMDLQFALGIEYDLNDDGTVADGEVHEYKQNRLYR
jgi:hypothetical protein